MGYDNYGFKISKLGRPEEPGETGAKIGAALRYFVDNYWPSIRDWIDAKDGRSEFTKATVSELWKREGSETVAGYIITDVKYRTSEEIDSWKIEYYGDFPFAQWEYTVLAFPNDRETWFTLLGDGGYLNWAVIGNFTSANGSPDVYFHETEYSKNKKREEQEKQDKEDEERLEKHLDDDEKWKKKHGGRVGPI
ncbi:hypothetical protein G6F46_006589 [Rhizopus delemar]|uniref:Uncharacterized protein n=2 Tax=Rhizopus TaxID=4842 RepID=A0A9P6ZB51_9FUNG|nr:hypothetical protein G6F55_001843 [Rhizopus delemar]KAG1550622.1 hypothetical protein G6F51_002339 [Rhizopus arrhizus]KAG1496325.1 hypothetical protein G6F54_006550 [Rhizopus delemar]KAG1517293.1 hypothetical protein G6F53_001480 [Rhizopus delemar]KAG1526094.1 hypothetical protein G6F52_002739 [Rhizopus delemar]